MKNVEFSRAHIPRLINDLRDKNLNKTMLKVKQTEAYALLS